MNINVIIVNYNGAMWLPRCIASVLDNARHSHHTIDVTVVDNASSDDSVKVIQSFGGDVRSVTLSTNVGFGQAVWRGVREHSSEYIVVLNNDTWLELGTFDKLLNELMSRNLDVIAANEQPYDGESTQRHRTTIDYLGFPIHIPTPTPGPTRSFYLSAVCLLVSRELFESSGGFVPSFFMYFEDIDWFWRLHLAGHAFDYSETVFVHHAGHGSSGGASLSVNRFLWRNENLPRMLYRNYSTASLILLTPLFIAVSLVEIFSFAILGKKDVALSYPRGLRAFLRTLPHERESRRAIQSARVTSEKEIRARMYPGSAKLASLFTKALERVRPNHG